MGIPMGFQWGFLWVWDGYGDWNAIPTAALVDTDGRYAFESNAIKNLGVFCSSSRQFIDKKITEQSNVCTTGPNEHVYSSKWQRDRQERNTRKHTETTNQKSNLMPATRAREICTRNFFKKLARETCMKNLTRVHHKFLTQQQLAGQSRCTVRVTCQTVSVLE